MSITGKWRTRASAALGAAILLLLGVTAARAEGIVPVEGGWVARTSVGLTVSFEVREGNVLNAHFRFKWALKTPGGRRSKPPSSPPTAPKAR